MEWSNNERRARKEAKEMQKRESRKNIARHTMGVFERSTYGAPKDAASRLQAPVFGPGTKNGPETAYAHAWASCTIPVFVRAAATPAFRHANNAISHRSCRACVAVNGNLSIQERRLSSRPVQANARFRRRAPTYECRCTIPNMFMHDLLSAIALVAKPFSTVWALQSPPTLLTHVSKGFGMFASHWTRLCHIFRHANGPSTVC
ncbi:predicted protein [Clavispora lusitaniae ATCC 42720]|uniref:Uncharacterized protein n=1 Tax=Clavispora lusitaniae (strain ATCC 42720) TaxID=306902 RepID=C4Y1P8_CLAL4|nr:uncharacterized protein CLUG_02130 [Clavispora lusitaniae ATCC 42720]EEQ38007.1 predicted protein [Clavispora lusitaniae ATCC 42720]